VVERRLIIHFFLYICLRKLFKCEKVDKAGKQYFTIVEFYCSVKLKKCKVVGMWRSVCIALHLLDLGTSWRRVISLMTWLLYSYWNTPGTHWIGSWLGPRASLVDMEKRNFLLLPRLELRPVGHPGHSQLLYWLCHLGSFMFSKFSYTWLWHVWQQK
jgi:hypothetical protein